MPRTARIAPGGMVFHVLNRAGEEGNMTDKAQLDQRLQQLREEYNKGQQMLAELQAQEADLQQKLLRISGAIQVLEELANQPSSDPEPDS